MIDYNNLDTVLDMLSKAQEADSDIRDNVRESHHFIDKKDGQWEDSVTKKYRNRPRYTFDKCNPIVDQVAGEIENADFTLRVRPAGGDASQPNAKVYDGLIRNIRNISNADAVFNQSGRSMVAGGADGWEIVQDWVDGDAFEQDLFIKKIHNWIDRVWFDPNSQEQDHSDAQWVVTLSTIGMNEYKTQFPDSSSSTSVGDSRTNEVYDNKPSDTITIGRLQWKKPIDIEIVQMNDGSVYEVDEDFEKIQDELAQAGITIELDNNGNEKRRTRKSHCVYQRLFNNSEWLNDEEKTVFELLPVCAVYGNYKVSENKRIYRGIVEKLIDSQRVYNYATSRQIEEGALSPRGKYWLTPEQASGHTPTLATMNTNSDPAQLYNHVDGQQLPFFQGGAQVNQGLQVIAAQADSDINKSAGLFSANMGDNAGIQSGVAIDMQISKGDNSTTKWFSALEVGICYTGKLLVNAIPKVYDSTRQVRILQDDGTYEMTTLNEKVFDQNTQQIVEINNLASGQYDVTCEAGLAFKSQQREAAAAFAELARIDPTIVEFSKDVMMKNQDFLGAEQVAERMRKIMLDQGVIPESQWTDEESAEIQQAQAEAQQQPPQEDPNMLIAQAEMGKAQAAQQSAQNKQMEIQTNQQLKAQELQLKQQQLQLDAQKFQMSKDDKFNVDAAKISQGQQKLDQSEFKLMMEQRDQQFNNALAAQAQQMDNLSKAIEQMKGIREAAGVDTIVAPQVIETFAEQTEIVSDTQDKLD